MRTGLLAVAICLIAPLSAMAADPPLEFQVQPLGRLLSDVRSVVKMVGGEKAINEFNDKLKEKLGEKGLEGLDLDRPVLGYVAFNGKIEELVGVLAVPVTGEKEFLELMQRLDIEKPKLVEKGLYELPIKDKDAKVLMRFEAQYAYIAIGKDPTSTISTKSLVPPAKLYDASEKSLASVRVHFDRLPKEIREQISDGLKGLKSKLDELQLPPDASEPARKAVDELIKLGNRYADLLQDAESATARVILDADSGEAALEVGLAGKPGSNLAKSIAARKPSTNKFAGLITPDTTFGLKLQLPFFAKEIQNAAVIGLEGGQKAIAANAPPQFKGLIDETFKGLIRTVNDGECDLTVALRGPDKDGLYTVVGAVAFEDPSGLEKELRALFKTEVPPMYKAIFNLDVAKVGNTNIHQAKVGAFLPPEAQKIFGDEASVTFAFAPHGIFIAFGPDAVNTLKTALEVKKTPSPVFELVSNPSRVRKFLAAIGTEVPMGVGNQDKLFSSLALSLEGGKELRLRLSTNLKSLEGAGSFGFGAKPVKMPPAPGKNP